MKPIVGIKQRMQKGLWNTTTPFAYAALSPPFKGDTEGGQENASFGGCAKKQIETILLLISLNQ